MVSRKEVKGCVQVGKRQKGGEGRGERGGR